MHKQEPRSTSHVPFGRKSAYSPRGACVRVVADHNGIVSRCTSERSPVSNPLLYVAADGSFRHIPQRKHVPDGERGLLATVDKLPRVHTLCSYEKLLLMLEPERMTEGDSGQRCTPSGVMHNLANDPLDVPIPLRVVNRPELSGALTPVRVGPEDGPRTLTLGPNYATHGRRRRPRCCT